MLMLRIPVSSPLLPGATVTVERAILMVLKGVIASTGLGGDGSQFGLPKFVPVALRKVGGALIGFNLQGGAMTQVWAATARNIVDEDIRGQYIMPAMGWSGGYHHSKVADPLDHAKDDEAAKKLWEVSVKAVTEAEAKAGHGGLN